ncbi:MAG: peroxiredoxin [Gammaproteobacteria bacterium]
MTVNLGEKIPDFTVPATGDKLIDWSRLRGWNVVIYFYPKDDTPGCTLEGQDFRDHYESFKKSKTLVIGVSRDSLKSHDRFQCKYGLPFPLASDEDESLCTLFGVVKMKNMYGKQVRGIERSTFLIDRDGVLRREWRGVKVDGHVAEVLAATQAL